MSTVFVSPLRRQPANILVFESHWSSHNYIALLHSASGPGVRTQAGVTVPQPNCLQRQVVGALLTGPLKRRHSLQIKSPNPECAIRETRFKGRFLSFPKSLSVCLIHENIRTPCSPLRTGSQLGTCDLFKDLGAMRRWVRQCRCSASQIFTSRR